MQLYDDEIKVLKREIFKYNIASSLIIIGFMIAMVVAVIVIFTMQPDNSFADNMFSASLEVVLFILFGILLVKRLKSPNSKIENYEAVEAECTKKYIIDGNDSLSEFNMVFVASGKKRYIVDSYKMYSLISIGETARLIVYKNVKSRADLLDKRKKNYASYCFKVSQKYVGRRD